MDLKVEREFEATAEQLYKVWTDPAQISEWFGVQVTIDPKVGGRLEFDFKEECGVTNGEFKELSPFTKVAFTWGAHHPHTGHLISHTLVSITIEEINANRCKMTLVHSGFEHQSHVDDHLEGWNEYYDMWEKRFGELNGAK